ncbi:MAG: dihydrofolate reductase [Planctomycetota bacterium]|jgi:lactate dehydrogenase-like 2-hydroxyacid dehydrogenase|nr:dihydrofolate reductase [Planctomycetota bacterium]
MKKVLITQWLPDSAKEGVPDGVELVHPPRENPEYTAETLRDAIADADGVLTILTRMPRELIDIGKKLQAIGNFGVGFDNIDYKYAGSKGICVVNTPNSVMHPTAEITIGLIIAAVRGLVRYDRELRTRKRVSMTTFPVEDSSLYGKTLGLVGFGRIGKTVARKAKGMGMRIIYHDVIRADETVERELETSLHDFDALLRTADIISMHCPYTTKNHHLMNEHAFSLMKPTAYFVNTARGPIHDEKALAAALRSGRIKGAGLDVFEDEPEILPELFELDNVAMVPHIGTSAYDVRVAMCVESLGGIYSCLHGGRPANVVNLDFFPK